MDTYLKIIIVIGVVIGFLWLIQMIMSTERIKMNAATREQAPGEFVNLSDGLTHYELRGSEDSPVVVLIPGATLATWVWNYLDDKLADGGFRVLSYDLLGRGFSDRPNKKYDLVLHRRQLYELIDHIAPGRQVHFVTLAFGTLIAADFIVNYPKRVESLVAIGPDGFGVAMAKQASSLLMAIPFVRNYIFSIIGTKVLMSRIPSYSTSSEAVREIENLYRPTLNWKGFKRSVISSVSNMPIHDARHLYQSIDSSGLPIKLIWGEDDAVTPYPGDQVVRSVFPNADLIKLPGGGHLPHFESPGPITEEILSFIKAAHLTKDTGGQ